MKTPQFEDLLEPSKFKEILETSPLKFEYHKGLARTDDGWKLSIQGKTMDDSAYLYEHLTPFLITVNASFKFGTQRLLTTNTEEQRTKLLTIYIPNGVDAASFAELVYQIIKDYEGGEDILPKRSYTHYKNAIYFRNDRDQYGEYINP